MSVLSDVSAFSNPFGATANGQWSISKGVFTTKDKPAKSIIFFYEVKHKDEKDGGFLTAVDQIEDSGSRRLAIYKYPYRDGQGIADLGRDGETYSFNIKFTGQNYQQKLQEFLSVVVNNKTGGTLLHPVRSGSGGVSSGAISVRFHTWNFVHRHDEWNAVTIKAVFLEDNTDQILTANVPAASQDSALRSALQTLTAVQAQASALISSVSAVLLLPGAISSAMQQRLSSIVNQVSGLLGQLASTFSSNQQLQQLSAQSANVAGGVTSLNSGTVTTTVSGKTQQALLPPVFQVGFDPTTQAAMNTQLSNFINANQVSTQEAMYTANQARTAILAAINEVNTNLGNYGYDTMVLYRTLSAQIQTVVESCIAAAQNQVTLYVVPNNMSLRMIASLNGLDPDDQNLIESLNPYLGSVNVIPKGSQILVPVA